MSETTLYTRNGDYIPRVAAVHDLCGYGKCSLGVAIPVLSAAGCDVCPVPTGLFSSHTAFPGWYMHDTTAMLKDYLTAWKNIGVEIDAVYSGFLGAPEQVDRIRDLYAMYPAALRVVDPVMADHGKVYPTYTPAPTSPTRRRTVWWTPWWRRAQSTWCSRASSARARHASATSWAA